MQDIQIPAMGRQTFSLIRGFGYCSLLFFLIDFSTIVLPPKFTDPAWELNVYGQVAERVPLLLLAFPLIFLGEYSARAKWEKIGTKIIAWLAIVIAVMFLLAVPLGIVNTFRVQGLRQAELITNVARQNAPAQAVADRLSTAQTDDEVRNVLRLLNPQQQTAIARISQPQEIKKQLLTEIGNSINQNQAQSEQAKRRITTTLWKSSVKWTIVSLISGLFLLYVWNQSKWARVGIEY